jgi:hypothetical protein
VERAESEEVATGKIEDRDAYGAFVLTPPRPRVLVATAASVPAAQLIEDIARSAGVRTVVDVKPTDPDDPRGATLNVLTLALVITSILAALVAVQLVPELRALGPRVAASSSAAILGGFVAIGIVKAERALPGSSVAEVAVVALAVLGIALSSAGLIRLIGPAGTGVPFLIFLMLGNPASGLASAPELLPTPWHPRQLPPARRPRQRPSQRRLLRWREGGFAAAGAGRLRRDRGDPQSDCLKTGRGRTLAGALTGHLLTQLVGHGPAELARRQTA